MAIQKLDNVCSVRHLHALQNDPETRQTIEQALKESGKIVTDCPPERSRGNCSKKNCTECAAMEDRYLKWEKRQEERKKNPAIKLDASEINFHYRYLIAFTDAAQKLYITPVLEEYGFNKLAEFVAYQGNPCTLWGLSIPEYVNRIGRLAK